MEDISKEDLSKPILIEDLGMLYATEKSKERRKFGIYKCSFCGTRFKANTNDIKNGSTKSCGCYHKRRVKESNKTHGLRYTRLYDIWADIKKRTLNPKNKAYNDYGGRGIKVCEEWKNDFMSFYDWAMLNGYEENKGLSIDRIDNDGNYEPNNCRWVSSNIQNRNKRIFKNNTSGFKGVSFRKKNKAFDARICVNKNGIFLGSFLTAVEAAKAYNNYIIENNLEGFILNEIPEGCVNG